MTMTTLRKCLLLGFAGLFALGSVCFAVESKSLLATDGTLYTVSAGTATDLNLPSSMAAPSDFVIQWSYLRQNGESGSGLIPGVAGTAVKDNIDLAYDGPSSSFVVLWTEEATLLNVLHLGVLHAGQWQVSSLLPNVGFPRAMNARLLLSHIVVHTIDNSGADVYTPHSILSIIWWEDTNISQARYAAVFLDEDSGMGDVQVYDLPAAIGGGGPTPSLPDVPVGAYLYPSLQPQGPNGGILASFADLNAGKHFVVTIDFPKDLGKPGPGNITWQRRHTPIVGIIELGPIDRMAPIDESITVSTFIGSGYHPTLAWRTSTSVQYSRYDGASWSDVNSIGLSGAMTYDKAMRLVQDMATKN